MGLNDFTGNNGANNNNGGAAPGGIPFAQPAAGDAYDPMEFLINYNDKFGTAGKILFRDDVRGQLMSVLIGKNKPNALLIGPAGVGKTKIVEDLAYCLKTDDPIVPDKIRQCTIYELPLSNIVAGSSFVGQVEAKLKSVVEFLSDPKNRAILFIDEIHQLVGESQTYEKIAQILKPALARGDIKTIGATTSQEAGKLMDDPALNRRFSRIIVDEFTKEQTIDILKAARPGFVTHYNNKIALTDDLMPTIVDLADEYRAAGSHRPDNALTLLDRTIGDALVQRKQAELAAQSDPAMQQALLAVPLVPITAKQLKKTALRMMTGSAVKQEFSKDALTTALEPIIGQDEILTKVIDLLRRDNMGLFPKKTPLTLLFTGASGVGKTEVTKIIAQTLTGVKPIILNMTEYHSPAAINRIIGAPAGYVGSDSNAELPFDILESNPYQVILLDEFEKADKAVQRLFMSVFDEGSLKTNRGKTVDFSRSIIIATTNAGHSAGASRPLGFAQENKPAASKIDVSKLSQWFDTELLNRFSYILCFNDLSKDDYRAILQDIYKREVVRIKSSRRISLLDEIPDDKLDEIVEATFQPQFGARPARKAARAFIEDQI